MVISRKRSRSKASGGTTRLKQTWHAGNPSWSCSQLRLQPPGRGCNLPRNQKLQLLKWMKIGINLFICGSNSLRFDLLMLPSKMIHPQTPASSPKTPGPALVPERRLTFGRGCAKPPTPQGSDAGPTSPTNIGLLPRYQAFPDRNLQQPHSKWWKVPFIVGQTSMAG